jgi:tRNA (guanine26-N2/guanine27-N2)-dimethyltransferase
MSGPFWIDDLHDEDFITSLKKTLNQKEFDYLKYKERIHLILKSIGDEMKLKDEIFYYDYSQCNRDVNLSSFKLSLFEGALNSLKYNMEQSYYDPNLFKTNAPCSVIYDILKKYKKSNYDEEDYLKNVKESSYKHNILLKDIKVEPVFKEAVKEKVLKYPMHPFANWGPKGKAKEKKQDE